MLTLYNLSIQLYSVAIRLAAGWNKKAAALVSGRKDVFVHLEQALSPSDRVIWVHCSSAGEFEQGKPVIEALKEQYPQKKIVVSFFSPSGYTVARNYALADVITYLPVDTRENAERFFKLVHPELVIFVKYEFWYHHLSAAAFHHVPLLLISAVFRPDQIFFKAHGKFFRQMLFLFRHLFVQDNASLRLLQSAGLQHCSLAGDTRFDRVTAIAANASTIPFIDSFTTGQKVIVAGSTWPGDEAALAAYLQENKTARLIIAPHEVNAEHIAQLQELFTEAVLYSSVKEAGNPANLATHRVLIIDSVGLLSRLYQYATITYVGGGFTRDGIHNILEAAVWGKPVLFGPNYQKYREGTEMIEAGGAFSFTTADELKKIADDLLEGEDHLQKSGGNAKAYIVQNTGATATILRWIQEKRLLTS